MRSVSRCIPLAGALRSRTARGLTAAGLALAALTATASPSQALRFSQQHSRQPLVLE